LNDYGQIDLGAAATERACDAIGPILERYPRATMREGDIYWYNDCYASHGAVSHSPDQVFACPVFNGEEIVAFAQPWAHFNDIGGMRAGSLSPDCEEIFQEGIIVPPVLIARDGRFNDELFRVFVRNSRFPTMVQGDTRASIAAISLASAAWASFSCALGWRRYATPSISSSPAPGQRCASGSEH
jgi:N-methylhydantoinase B